VGRLAAAACGAAVAAAAVSGCGRAPAARSEPGLAAATAPVDRRADEHSYAEPARVRIERLRLDLRVDFEARQLAGTAALGLAWARPLPPYRLILDTRDLVIERIEAVAPGEAPRSVPFALGPRDPILGSPLAIALDRAYPEVRNERRQRPGAGPGRAITRSRPGPWRRCSRASRRAESVCIRINT